jgi:hypothetical protein
VNAARALVAGVATATAVFLGCGTQTWSFDVAACASDADCGVATLHCDTGSGQCVPCVVDSQCTQTGLDRCDSALHQSVQCGVTGDCAGGQVCEPTSHSCVTSCADGGVCPAGATCDATRAVCVGCTTDVDCASSTAGHFCDPGSRQCVACTLDSQCSAPTRFCNPASDKCVGCLTGATCESHICDPATFTCKDE